MSPSRHRHQTRSSRLVGVRVVAVDERPVPEPESHGLRSLRRARDHDVRTVDGLPCIHCRHGGQADAEALHRPHRQRWELRAWKLSMGDARRPVKEYVSQSAHDCVRTHANIARLVKGVWSRLAQHRATTGSRHVSGGRCRPAHARTALAAHSAASSELQRKRISRITVGLDVREVLVRQGYVREANFQNLRIELPCAERGAESECAGQGRERPRVRVA